MLSKTMRNQVSAVNGNIMLFFTEKKLSPQLVHVHDRPHVPWQGRERDEKGVEEDLCLRDGVSTQVFVRRLHLDVRHFTN